jgi:hypothetical protein
MILTGTFFDLSAGDIATATAYTSGFIKDFWPILAILLGLSIAGIIVGIFFRR